MTAHVVQVVKVWRGADGLTAEVVLDGSALDAIEKWKPVEALKGPAVPVATRLVLQDCSQVLLPFIDGLAYRLPDRTGVLAIFRPGEYTASDGTDHFPAPNNAAIFNVDGSLRCRVRFKEGAAWVNELVICLPFTREINRKPALGLYGPPGEPIDPPVMQYGVLVGTRTHPPEHFYILDCETGELTNGLFSVRL